mmetsp:Transcript_12732/g.18501  ORF Transcript_12732/g.18501 Transcript_12732/m.18501 type:complete len:208 (+) Transcript_12732:63-686(+)
MLARAAVKTCRVSRESLRATCAAVGTKLIEPVSLYGMGLAKVQEIHCCAISCQARRFTAESYTTNEADQDSAALLRRQLSFAPAATASLESLNAIPAVEIDSGVFKYVLLRAWAASGEERFLVRGKLEAEYHKDVARPYCMECMAAGIGLEVLGGGRIRHDPDGRQLYIYGFSYGFPWSEGAGHEITAAVCRKAYPSYVVEWSNDGY